MQTQKPQLRKGFDLDGVLFNFSGHFLEYLKIEDKSPAMFWDEPRFKDNFHKIALDPVFWLSMPRLVENPRILDGHVTCYCTARPIPVEISMQSIQENGFPPAPVYSVGHDGSKLAYLSKMVDVFLDDAIHNFEELNAGGVNCYLYTRPHNLSYVTDKRIDTIEQFLNL